METTSEQIIEKETKSQLTEEQYLQLMTLLRFKIKDSKKQINYYFDDFDFKLFKHKLMLRVREKKQEHELTIKEPSSEDDRLETNYRPFTTDQFSNLKTNGVLPDCNVSLVLKKYNLLGPYIYYGQLATLRIEIFYKGCKLALDHNIYLGKEDYEIEMEKFEEDVDERQVLLSLLNSASIPYVPSEPKYKRFFKLLAEQKLGLVQ